MNGYLIKVRIMSVLGGALMGMALTQGDVMVGVAEILVGLLVIGLSLH